MLRKRFSVVCITVIFILSPLSPMLNAFGQAQKTSQQKLMKLNSLISAKPIQTVDNSRRLSSRPYRKSIRGRRAFTTEAIVRHRFCKFVGPKVG